ncbi:MAG: phospholipid carrier-dependent glycosyltransferase [Propionibacteriaceae bacterium]|nr:phospholipid carrier-dependent glycosyltransferase [Propionibacteriaceae bacterium]
MTDPRGEHHVLSDIPGETPKRLVPSAHLRARLDQARAKAIQDRRAAGFVDDFDPVWEDSLDATDDIAQALDLLEVGEPDWDWIDPDLGPDLDLDPDLVLGIDADLDRDLDLAKDLDLAEEPELEQPWVPAPADPPSSQPQSSQTKKPHRYPTSLIKASQTRPLDTVVDRLRSPLPPDRLIGWIVTAAITALAFVIRLFRIDYPASIMFDETYYAKDAWSLLKYGYEGRWYGEGDEVNSAFATGDYSALSTDGSSVVHPPLGKWLIASGEWLFGLTPLGWRFASLVFGCLLVMVVIRLTRRLAHSTLIGGIAGLLLTVDGLHFLMSRMALLDIFQSFFIVAGVSCIVADRDFFRNRLASRLVKTDAQSFHGHPGPFIVRPWLVGAGILLGFGCAVKWNTIYVIAVFGLLVVAWSISARRLAGAGRTSWKSLYLDGVPAFVSIVVVGIASYLVTWIPWLRTTGGNLRDWGVNNPDSPTTKIFGEGFASLWHWHVSTYDFHVGEDLAGATHSYQSSPWSWPVVGRTVGIYADNGIASGVDGCTASAGETCMRVVTALGTPLLWWAACLAMVLAVLWWIGGMDWRFGVVVCGMAATWIPWMWVGTRPIFSFYAITIIPFMVIALAMALGVIIGPVGSPRREAGAMGAGVLIALIVLNFAFLYPVVTGALIPRTHWQWRMWLPGWV